MAHGTWRPAAAAWKGFDAHAAWACASGFGAAGHARLPLLVEVRADASASERREIARWIDPPGVYAAPGRGRFWTGSVAAKDLLAFARLPGLARWRFGLVASHRRHAAAAAGRVEDEGEPVPTVGLIDHGIAFAHRAFRRPGEPGTRVLAFWDQDASRMPAAAGPWRPVRGLGYGAELRAADIDAAVRRFGDDEAALYRALAYAPALPRGSHGTHVLDLAAGDADPLRLPRAAGRSADGCARRAPIVAVQLPHLPFKDTSGASLAVQVLDALHYIVARAPHGRPVVINLSDGAYGGPHDGHAMLDEAIDDFLAGHPQVQLVLAAGNAHEAKLHACSQRPLVRGAKVRFDWRVLPDDGTDSFVEVWFERSLGLGEARLHLHPPGGSPPVSVPLGASAVFQARGAPQADAAVISRIDAPNRRGRSMYLVALSTTRRASATRPQLPHGLWRIEVENVGADRPIDVQAWIERDDPALNDRTPRRQSTFLENAGGGARVTGARTLGSLAGGARPWVIGARYAQGSAFSGERPGAWPPVAQARYSSRGPGRAAGAGTDGPDLLAPGDTSPVRRGLLAAGSRSGSAFTMGGTSVAAPLVTRRIIDLLGAEPGLERREIADRLMRTEAEELTSASAVRARSPAPRRRAPGNRRASGP